MNIASALDRAGNVLHERKDVNPVMRRRAELVVALTSRRLAIKTPAVRWLPAGRNYLGCAYPTKPTEIWICADQGNASLIEAAAHECRHLWQTEGYAWTAQTTEEDLERDAWIYGRRIATELGG
jgi:hypothetical protein